MNGCLILNLNATGNQERGGRGGNIMENEEFEPLTFDEILEDKEYQAEFDRRVQKAIATAKTKWESNSDEVAALRSEIDGLKNQIASNDEAKSFNRSIDDLVGDRKFVNEYTRDAIVKEVKEKMNANNVTLNEAFDEITKDKMGIFENPNAPEEIPTPSANVFENTNKEAFDKMSYNERLTLKQENPELFEALNNMK
jgi:hypothetical protein